jgi:hypothetical protein
MTTTFHFLTGTALFWISSRTIALQIGTSNSGLSVTCGIKIVRIHHLNIDAHLNGFI